MKFEATNSRSITIRTGSGTPKGTAIVTVYPGGLGRTHNPSGRYQIADAIDASGNRYYTRASGWKKAV